MWPGLRYGCRVKKISTPTLRYDLIDALRGAAIVWMTLFHFCFDLNQFGYIRQNFYADPFWTVQRACIVSLFMFTAGLGQAVAQQQAVSWTRFGRRWAQVAVCALLVTAGSWLMYPRSFIYFGVLHGLALMLIVARLTAHWGRWLWLLGALALLLPQLAPWLHAHAVLGEWTESLNRPALNWLGLISRKPITEDYAPLLPWLGVLWWGLATGGELMRVPRSWLHQRFTGAGHLLTTLGRFSLPYYMLHQLVLIGALMGLHALVGA